MRITRETLLKVARETVSQRTRTDRGLLAIYLCGSLLEEDFTMGGTADVDLVFIHTDYVTSEREVVPLTDDVHLDISHQLHKDYRQTRQLRVHPWLGPTLYKCKILYDPQHFMDFTQASVRGQFDRSDYVMERARKQAEHARQIWLYFHTEQPQPGSQEVAKYLHAVDHAANAVASLSGPPLTERRFLLNFSERVDNLGRPGMYAGLLGLLGLPNVAVETLKTWLPAWRSAYEAIPVNEATPRLHPSRRTYYQQAFESMLKGEQPQAAIWPLVRTWTQIINTLPVDSPAQSTWGDAFLQLGLLGEGFPDRIAALDAYLDTVEETLESWARANGA